MKIKNFKMNKKAVSKLATCGLVGSLAITTLTGCGDNLAENNILKGTILKNTCVVTFDNGFKDIAVAVNPCSENKKYAHYCSIISGEYFVSEKCKMKYVNGVVAHHYVITNEESIVGYLTTDELTKAVQGELDNNDIINIVSRTITSTTEETKTQTK